MLPETITEAPYELWEASFMRDTIIGLTYRVSENKWVLDCNIKDTPNAFAVFGQLGRQDNNACIAVPAQIAEEYLLKKQAALEESGTLE